MRAESESYASYVQLAGMTATARAAISTLLTGDGVNYAIDAWENVDQAFYMLGSGGTLNGPLNHTIDLNEYESMLPEFRGGRISGKMTYSVGIQLDPPLPSAEPVNLYAQPSGDFPGGLESLIVGSSWGALVAAIAAALMIVRTAKEDAFLQRELDGYAQYARETRARLVPGLW